MSIVTHCVRLQRATARRLVGVGDVGKPAGVFAADDLLRLLATEIEGLAEAPEPAPRPLPCMEDTRWVSTCTAS